MLDGFWEWSGDLVSNTVGGIIDIGKEAAKPDPNYGGNPTVADKVTTAPPVTQKDNTLLYMGAGFGGLLLVLLLVFLAMKGGK